MKFCYSLYGLQIRGRFPEIAAIANDVCRRLVLISEMIGRINFQTLRQLRLHSFYN